MQHYAIYNLLAKSWLGNSVDGAYRYGFETACRIAAEGGPDHAPECYLVTLHPEAVVPKGIWDTATHDWRPYFGPATIDPKQSTDAPGLAQMVREWNFTSNHRRGNAERYVVRDLDFPTLSDAEKEARYNVYEVYTAADGQTIAGRTRMQRNHAYNAATKEARERGETCGVRLMVTPVETKPVAGAFSATDAVAAIEARIADYEASIAGAGMTMMALICGVSEKEMRVRAEGLVGGMRLAIAAIEEARRDG